MEEKFHHVMNSEHGERWIDIENDIRNEWCGIGSFNIYAMDPEYGVIYDIATLYTRWLMHYKRSVFQQGKLTENSFIK